MIESRKIIHYRPAALSSLGHENEPGVSPTQTSLVVQTQDRRKEHKDLCEVKTATGIIPQYLIDNTQLYLQHTFFSHGAGNNKNAHLQKRFFWERTKKYKMYKNLRRYIFVPYLFLNDTY